MSMKPARVQFNGGELSPWLEARLPRGASSAAAGRVLWR